MIKVLLVDDDPYVRHGLRTILEGDPGIEIAAEAGDGHEGVEAFRSHRCDVALVDIRMPRMDGLAATRALLALPSPPAVIVLTTFRLDEYVSEAVLAGAAGFLLKDTPPGELVRAVRTVADGHAILSPEVTRQVLDTVRRGRNLPTTDEQAKLAALTPRELEVLTLLGRGLSNADVAGRLFVSESTVKMHVSRVLTKLALDNGLRSGAACSN
ncbi:response regulator [Streptomyces sp. 5.8]|uniref:response regulator n=1 Tax=Streptomyces sp. 5.8 TaxID=3406571 RepID=UPI003BB6A769